MNAQLIGKEISLFMEYPTPRLSGRITDGLAKSIYYSFNDLMPVVAKIEKIRIVDADGIYNVSVHIQDSWCSIKIWRTKAPALNLEKQIVYVNEGDKLESIRLAVAQFAIWYKNNCPVS